MPLPVSGAISFNDINVELGVAGATQASLGQESYRALAGVPSGQISMSNFYGKANAFAFTISSNQVEANLRTLALAAGWNGTSAVQATVASGVYITSPGGTGGGSGQRIALVIDGSWPGGVTLINNGFIVGGGGAGGLSNTLRNGEAGSTAISLGANVSITNNGYIAGGGGGGGRGGNSPAGGGGGGAGGGAGGGGFGTSGTTTGVGGARPAVGNPGFPGQAGGGTWTRQAAGGGAGGGGGSLSGPTTGTRWGSGGGSGGWVLTDPTGGLGAIGQNYAGGNGGSANNNGTNAVEISGASSGGGGGGFGASGGRGAVGVGGVGGNAVRLNGFSVTWLTTGTRWGAIS